MAKTAVALIVWLCLALPAFSAQPTKQAAKPVRPAWSELTPPQQQVLAPLAADWHEMDSSQRKKWVTIANRYPKMKAPEQERLQQRMKDWAALTPEQRQSARERYQDLKKRIRRSGATCQNNGKPTENHWRSPKPSLTRP